jgi:multiple sugar transport system substrate-binding protein
MSEVFGQNLPGLKEKNLGAVFKSKASEPKQITKYDGDAEAQMVQGINAVVKGEKDINTALREMEENLNKRVAQDGK